MQSHTVWVFLFLCSPVDPIAVYTMICDTIVDVTLTTVMAVQSLQKATVNSESPLIVTLDVL